MNAAVGGERGPSPCLAKSLPTRDLHRLAAHPDARRHGGERRPLQVVSWAEPMRALVPALLLRGSTAVHFAGPASRQRSFAPQGCTLGCRRALYLPFASAWTAPTCGSINFKCLEDLDFNPVANLNGLLEPIDVFLSIAVETANLETQLTINEAVVSRPVRLVRRVAMDRR
jgi:hypothetical protein